MWYNLLHFSASFFGDLQAGEVAAALSELFLPDDGRKKPKHVGLTRVYTDVTKYSVVIDIYIYIYIYICACV